MGMLVTRLTREYGVEHPVALAGLAFVGTTPDLAAAICKAGGIGSIAVGPLPAPAVRSLIRAVRQATDRPLHVNFITFLCREEQVQVCIDERVPIVSFHWGHPPRGLIDRLHGAGIKVWEQVGSVEAARAAAADGIDLIVAQGSEAGGHNYGTLPTFVLVPAVVEAVEPVPVLAAGGIATGRQLAAALALGAVGGWVGTRFVASAEAFAHPVYQQRLLESDGTQTCLTAVYGPDLPHFNPMRVLDTGLAREYAGREDQVPSDVHSQPRIGTMQLMGAEVPLHRFSSFVPTPQTEGDISQLPFLAGQGVGFVREIRPAGEILTSMVEEAVAALSALSPTACPS
jgi:NAD(P)H-dependent flavin oxidoreductase YrpB (nitropropane dioxygenase family)